MLSKSESKNSQNPTHLILDEAKAKRDSPSNDLPKTSIKTGTWPIIYLFKEILIFHFPNFLPWFNFDQRRYLLDLQHYLPGPQDIIIIFVLSNLNRSRRSLTLMEPNLPTSVVFETHHIWF